jgi:hypothetical protein
VQSFLSQSTFNIFFPPNSYLPLCFIPAFCAFEEACHRLKSSGIGVGGKVNPHLLATFLEWLILNLALLSMVELPYAYEEVESKWREEALIKMNTRR